MQVRKNIFIMKYLLLHALSQELIRFIAGVLQVLPVWALAIPLPAVLLITLSLYMVVLGVGLWIRTCLKVAAAAAASVTCKHTKHITQCFHHVHLAAAARWGGHGGTTPIGINTTLITDEHEVLKVTSSLTHQVRVSVVVKNRAASYWRKRKRSILVAEDNN